MPPKSGLEFATVERLVTVNPESSNPLFPPSYAYRRSDHPDFSGWSFFCTSIRYTKNIAPCDLSGQARWASAS